MGFLFRLITRTWNSQSGALFTVTYFYYYYHFGSIQSETYQTNVYRYYKCMRRTISAIALLCYSCGAIIITRPANRQSVIKQLCYNNVRRIDFCIYRVVSPTRLQQILLRQQRCVTIVTLLKLPEHVRVTYTRTRLRCGQTPLLFRKNTNFQT